MEKLAKELDDKALAKKLFDAGYTNPGQIRKTPDVQLSAAGLTKAELDKVRTVWPRR